MARPLVALLLGLGLVGCGAAPRAHVLILSIDSLRADHLGSYGSERPTSPHIDALARDGLLFERALSSTSWTLPAHVALFTGLADSLHGVIDGRRALAPGIPTLAERLSQAGWSTGAVVSGPYLHPRYGLARGFDDYLNCMSFLDRDFRARGAVDLRSASHRDVTGPCVVRRATEWLDRHTDRPSLLFLHFWDVHYDYAPPNRWADRFDPDYRGDVDASDYVHNPAISLDMAARDLEHVIALYDAEVAYTDALVGKVLGHLDALGIRDSTLVVLLSDHGDAFFEHGEKGHQKDLHAEVIRIPLIFRGPGVPAGVRRPGPVSITDVAPTILDLLDLRDDGVGRAGNGVSLVEAFAGADAPSDRLVYSELRIGTNPLVSLEGLERKLILDLDARSITVYDLAQDPLEQRPRPAGRGQARPLETHMWALQTRADDFPMPTMIGGLEVVVRERLRELGYAE